MSETGPPNSSSVVSDGHTVDTFNLAAGILTPFATGFVKAAGAVWVPVGGGADGQGFGHPDRGHHRHDTGGSHGGGRTR